MDDAFKIYVERLKEGKPETLNESFAPTFMEVDEKELAFEAPIEVQGEAFVTDDALVISGQIKTKARIPCSICNELTEIEIEIPSFAHTENMSDVRAGVYNLAPVLREALLLELPSKVECGGACPERENIKKYLSKSGEE